MKRNLSAAWALLAVLPLAAQEQDWTKRVHPIPEVTIVGERPIKEIGVQQTKFDSVVLKENIALSMADVLAFNSSIFVKSYGRATLSTVAFRGTSPSHTQVTWNGMRINNPMLGMTDFSMIPSYFIDDASLLHGTSSVNETGGGLGGAVKLATKPAGAEGFGLQYIQGIGSFRTFDEFLRLTYGDAHWQVSTRAVCSSSPNDYKYRNRDNRLFGVCGGVRAKSANDSLLFNIAYANSDPRLKVLTSLRFYGNMIIPHYPLTWRLLCL